MFSNNSTASLSISIAEAIEEKEVTEASSFQGFCEWLGEAQKTLIQDQAARADFGDRAWGSVHPWENTGMADLFGVTVVAHPEFSNKEVSTDLYFYFDGSGWKEQGQGCEGSHLLFK